MPAFMTGPIALGTRTYTHDNAGRLTQTSDSAGSAAHQEVQAYNPDNSLASTTVQASGSDRSKYAYSYDANGSVTGRVVSGSAQSYTESFAYNPAQNLTSHTLDSTTTTYGWDRNGNRLSAQVGSAAATTWTYRANNAMLSHTIPGQGLRLVSQDVVGRTTSDACATYTYDGFDRMASTTQKTLTGCATDWTAGTTTTYTYDGLDRQRSSTITGSATTAANDATKSFYDGLSDTLIGQVDAQNGAHTDPNTYYQLDPTGAQIGIRQSSLSTWLDDDGQGSITTQTTSTGATACAVKYDPFGNPLSPNTMGNGVCATGTQLTSTANAVWYRGYTRDAAAGSYQLGTRTYQPGIAGFTTPDTHRVSTPETDLSVGTDPLTANTYTYVNGNPVNAYDPTGHRAMRSSGDKNPILEGLKFAAPGSPAAAALYGIAWWNVDGKYRTGKATAEGLKKAIAKRPKNVQDVADMWVDIQAGVILVGAALLDSVTTGRPDLQGDLPPGVTTSPFTDAATPLLEAGGANTDSYSAMFGRGLGEAALVLGTGGVGLTSTGTRLGGRLAPALLSGTRGSTEVAPGLLRNGLQKLKNLKPTGKADDLRVPVESANGGTKIPTVVFSRGRAPGIANNFSNAVTNGAPTRLTRVDAAARDANRRAALRGQPPAPAGQSLDEYPFACSAQGGCGSFVSPVPRDEQNYQGGVLSQFFQRSDVQPGDPFNVEFGP